MLQYPRLKLLIDLLIDKLLSAGLMGGVCLFVCFEVFDLKLSLRCSNSMNIGIAIAN